MSRLEDTSKESPIAKKFPVYCLTVLTPQDEARYRDEFEKEKISRGLLDPVFIPWHPKENAGRAEGDLSDMYRIWKLYRHKDRPALDEHMEYCFFIDRQACESTGVIVADSETWPLCSSRDGRDFAQRFFRAARRQNAVERLFSELVGIDLDTDDEVELDVLRERLTRFFIDYPDYLEFRGLPYGRISAKGLFSVWQNLNISNMGMSELVEVEGRREVPDEGIVFVYENPQWDDDEIIRKLLEEKEKTI